MIVNPFDLSQRDGKLTVERWQHINQAIARTNGLEHDDLIAHYGSIWGLSPRRLKAVIKTYRLHSPPMLQ